MLDSVAVLLRLHIRFIGVMLFLVLYNNNNSDVIINLAGLHLDSIWSLAGLINSSLYSEVDSRLIFGWVATKEKMVDGLQDFIWTLPDSRWSPTGICGGV